METVMYDDFNAAHNTFLNPGMNNINQLKRKLTLDLDLGSGGGNGSGKQMSVIKKAKVASLNTPLSATTLNSPDVKMLALATPELERLIIQQTSMLPTPTPTQAQIFFPRNVTEEQEAYAQGFTDALSKLHGGTSSTDSNSMSNNIVLTTTASNNISLANTMVNTSTVQTLSNAVLTQDPQFSLIHHQVHNTMNPKLVPVSSHQPPPPAYYDPDSSDASDDTMSESSCSNSTNSSTYATGHVVAPTSSMLNNSSHAAFSSVVTSANAIVPHRLPDYGINQMSIGGATGSSGNIAAIPVSAAGYPHNSSNSSPIPVLIKEEPQTVPSVSSPNPVTPIDMETQEQIKLERKRQRNRLAASKCRKRKLERISKLEDKVKQLKGENSELTTVLNKLKDTVCNLKQQVMDHVNSGCQMMIPPNLSSGF